MRLFHTSILIGIVLLAGCYHREDDSNHIVHAREIALLAHGSAPAVPIALAKRDTHSLARAFDGGDEAAVRKMIIEGHAVFVPANTHVRVTGESFNERHVTVQEGEFAGKDGWVPFEWLKVPPHEHRAT